MTTKEIKKWTPKKGEGYWYLNGVGSAWRDIRTNNNNGNEWVNDNFYKWRLITNNVFRTEKEAEQRSEEITHTFFTSED